MKHFGVFLTDLESERFTTASNGQITTWLFLHAFCSKQTNGGTIKHARSLPDRFWSRHGIDGSILELPSPLWSWNGDDLSVEPYDIGGEELYLKKSKGGIIGNEKRWKGTDNRSPNRSPNPPNLTRPNLTRPNLTRPNHSSSGDEGEFFDKSSFDPSSESNPLDRMAESIYQEYPRKVSKKEGIKAIKKAMKTNKVAFLKIKTMEYATATTGHDKQFMPHPATWFNEERFNDDPKEWERSNKSSSTNAKASPLPSPTNRPSPIEEL